MSDAKLLADFAQIALSAGLVLHHGGATDHLEVGDLGEVGQDLVLHAIGEESVLFILAQISERQNGDALVGDGWGSCCCRRWRGARAPLTKQENARDHRPEEKERDDRFVPWDAAGFSCRRSLRHSGILPELRRWLGVT